LSIEQQLNVGVFLGVVVNSECICCVQNCWIL